MFAGAVWLLPESLPPAHRLTETWAATARRAARVLTRRRFVGYTAVVVFAYATLIAYVSASPFVLQVEFGLTPVGYSLAFAANAAGLTIGSFANARMLRRTSPRRLLSIGLAAEAVVALVVLAGAVTATLTAPVLLALLWAAVTSLGFIMGNATSLALDEAPHERGSASALLGAGQFGLAALVAPVASIGGGAVAMGATMAACAVVAAVACALAARAPHAVGVDPAGFDPVE
jgi:DHA1 family bicyclomycin/chloramphenicol resistance-like MFS transporter